MKIQQLLDASDEASAKVSDLSRQLAFSGIAVIWVLQVGGSDGGIEFSSKLLLPLYCFTIGLALDFVQYLYKTALWSALNWSHWRKHQDNDAEVYVPGYVNLPTNIIFLAKISAVVYGYFNLLVFIKNYL